MDTLKCGGCEKNRARSRFSGNQIKKFDESKRRAARARNMSLIVLPRCSDCSGAPAQELRCVDCDVTKSLDQFSKQQRKQGDNARCLNCSQDRQDLEPEHKDQVQEELTMEMLRMGAGSTYIGAGSTSFGHPATSRTMGYSNGLSASTNADANSDWIQPPIPVPDDPRARHFSGSSETRSPSVVSGNTYVSSTSAMTGTDWDNYTPLAAAHRRESSSSTGRGGSSQRFARQGAVRPDATLKAQNALYRMQIRENEQADQAATHDSDNNSDDDGNDSEDPY